MAEPEQKLEIIPSGPKGQSLTARAQTVQNFLPRNLKEAMDLAKLIARSDLAPKDFKEKPANVLIAMQMGAEVGLAPMQAIQNIAVINGRPSLWGDAALAVVMAHPDFEDCEETTEGDGQTYKAICTLKRKNRKPVTRSFSWADAVKAELLSKSGPWKTYPKRMYQMRARGFAMRDLFADALRGMNLAEEAMDMPPVVQNIREAATIDVDSELATLEESAEGNRGHGNEGMQQTKAQPAGAPATPAAAGTQEPPQAQKQQTDAQRAKESKSTSFIPCQVNNIEARMKNDKPYLILQVTDAGGGTGPLYSWHQSHHPELLKTLGKQCIFECTCTEKDGKKYFQIEHLDMIGDTKFVNDLAVSASGTAEATS